MPFEPDTSETRASERKPPPPPPPIPGFGRPETRGVWRRPKKKSPTPTVAPEPVDPRTAARERLHRLVDEMSDADLATTLRIVERERHDGLLEAHRNAPEDDEAWTLDPP